MEKINFGVFGCSYSDSELNESEIKEGRANWVSVLAGLRINWNFYNHAKGGADLTWNLYNFIEYKKIHPDHYIIFQIPLPWRASLSEDQFADIIVKENCEYCKQLDNLYLATYHGNQITLGPWIFQQDFANEKPRPKHLSDYWQRHLKYWPVEYEKLNRKLQIDYIKKNADIVYYHWLPYEEFQDEIDSNTPVVKECLTDQQWQDFICDKAQHFNNKGAQWTAHWVEQLINAKLFSG